MNTFLEDIFGQPEVLTTVLVNKQKEDYSSIDRAARMIALAPRVVLTSMGSAYYSMDPMAFYLNRLHQNVHLIETSELMNQPLYPQTLYVIMSRSGESKEIVEFSTMVRSRGEPLLVITMTPTSSLAQNATLIINNPSTYDGFICTKAFSTLALIGLLIASRLEETLDDRLITSLRTAFDWMEKNKHMMLEKTQEIDWLGPSLTYLSRGAGLGLAQAGALWLEEAARVRASYSSIDFFLHGPIEQVDEFFNGVWIDLLPDGLTRKQRQTIFEKGGEWIAIGPEIEAKSGFVVPGFDLPEAYRIIPATMIVQLIAYQSATNRGLNAGDMRYLNWVVKRVLTA